MVVARGVTVGLGKTPSALSCFTGSTGQGSEGRSSGGENSMGPGDLPGGRPYIRKMMGSTNEHVGTSIRCRQKLERGELRSFDWSHTQLFERDRAHLHTVELGVWEL